MKRNFVLLATMAVASLMVSCQKEDVETIYETAIVRQTLVIDDALTKTIYEPGKGVHFTGKNDEVVSVFYASHDDAEHVLSKVLPKKKEKGTVEFVEFGKYNIAHPALSGANTYDYFCVLNGCLSDVGGSKKKLIASQVSYFQEPTATSFDPTCDPLLCKPIANVAKSSTLTITDYKRLTSPLKLVLKDSGNKLQGTKVHMVTLSTDQEKDNKASYPFAGTCYIHLDPSGAFDVNQIESISSDSWSNSVTANYHSGQAFDGQSMDVWYSIYPTTLKANSHLTLTVTTESMTISRTVPISADVVVKEGQLNTLTFDISGEGCIEVESVYQSFARIQDRSLKTLPTEYTATDAKLHKWAFNGFGYENGKQTLFSNSTKPVFPEGIHAEKSGAAVTYPTDLIPAGKAITKVRIYLHPKDKKKSIDNTNRQTNKDVIVLTEADHGSQTDWQKSFTTKVDNTYIVGIAFEFAPAA